MGGEVAFSIRDNGKQETREFSKHAASVVCTTEFFARKGDLHRHWNKAPRVPFAPLDYGLVAVDFDKKWSGSVQDYTGMNAQYFNGIQYRGEPEKLKKELAGLHAAGRLVGLKGIEDFASPPTDDFNGWFKSLMSKARAQNCHSLCALVAPPKGWTIQHYPDTGEGWSEFVKALHRNGWEFGPEDITTWQSYSNHRGAHAADSISALIAEAAYEDLDAATTQEGVPLRARNRF